MENTMINVNYKIKNKIDAYIKHEQRKHILQKEAVKKEQELNEAHGHGKQKSVFTNIPFDPEDKCLNDPNANYVHHIDEDGDEFMYDESKTNKKDDEAELDYMNNMDFDGDNEYFYDRQQALPVHGHHDNYRLSYHPQQYLYGDTMPYDYEYILAGLLPVLLVTFCIFAVYCCICLALGGTLIWKASKKPDRNNESGYKQVSQDRDRLDRDIEVYFVLRLKQNFALSRKSTETHCSQYTLKLSVFCE